MNSTMERRETKKEDFTLSRGLALLCLLWKAQHQSSRYMPQNTGTLHCERWPQQRSVLFQCPHKQGQVAQRLSIVCWGLACWHGEEITS